MQRRLPFVIHCQRQAHSAGIVLLALLSLALSGCGTGYLLQAARGQWQVMHGRQPLTEVIARPDTDEALRTRLQRVAEARDFASSVLELPDNQSYRTFRALGRPYVVWNVVATPEFSLAPKRWCFPFTGCLNYRGYFHAAAAQRYAAGLQRQGLDTTVGGVSAYSTLGHFSDPVLDTMLRGDDLDLIGTMFHELAHQRVYARGDSAFSESFAMAVEYEGLRRWLFLGGRESEVAKFRERQQVNRGLQQVLLQGRETLRRLYAQPLSPTSMRQRKAMVMQETATALKAYEAEHQLRSGYDNWVQQGLNNAHLASIGTYSDCVPAFDALLARDGGSLDAFYADAQRLAKGPAAGRQQFCAAGGRDNPPGLSSPRR